MSMKIKQGVGAVALLLVSLGLLGCAGQGKPSRASCAAQVDAAWQELDLAKAEGFAGTVSYTKAAGLLSVAKTMQTVENFSGCYEQAKKARFYISESRKGR
ncbi:hypothetical protein [Balneatrix alpica]|uniref:hypothetical protein n=1 Tax=Balneatrix alpica TaxID=75684 RepID=UPI0034E95EE8